MKNNKGFSLVELIVVIAIMAILATVAVVSYSIYIEKAQEESDRQYKENVEYIAQLLATEHQFVLDRVQLNDVVDGPEDITLIVLDPVTGEKDTYTYDDEEYREVIQEIYDAVGDWEFIVLKQECNHKNCTIVSNTATCLDPGECTYSCGAIEESSPLGHDIKTIEIAGEIHEKCNRDGCDYSQAGGVKPPDAD